MAPSPQTPVGRYLVGLVLVLIAMYAGVLGAGLSPKLGLDLEGGTSVILTPQAHKGNVSQAQLDQAVKIIRQRVNGTGVTEAEVVTQGSNIVISVPGKGRGSVKELGSTAQLRFRQVEQELNPGPITPTKATPTPTPSGSAKPSATPSAKPSVTPSAKPSVTPSGQPSAAPSARASASPAASATGNGRPVTGALVAAAATPAPSAKASAAASAVPSAAPSAVASSAASPQPSTATSAVPATDAADTAALQQRALNLDCTKPEAREGLGGHDDPSKPLVACNRDGTIKYLLAPAKVLGTGVSGASAELDTQDLGAGWQVIVDFNGKGQSKFTQLTRDVVKLPAPQNQVAIVLDGLVISAPTIQSAIPGNAQITGNFTDAEAKDLANVLKYGALPLTFKTSQEESISPTLGRDQLDAGLLAGGIGLGLVVLYSLLYYRGLGVVTIASLILAGLVTYAAVALLGAQLDYRLSLAGVAGLIVSIGITADSFVVFYERVKDEVRDGKTLRQAVDRGWVRGRRTILSADTVSFLAAVILYFVSVGAVRGFAFTLGLSTLIDVFIVFVFTRPVVTLLARSKRFSSPRFTGLHPVARTTVPRTARQPATARAQSARAVSADGPGASPSMNPNTKGSPA